MPSRSPQIRPYVLSPHVADLVVERRPSVVGSTATLVDTVVAYRDESKRRRKVAICGAGGVRQMPWDDPSYECWSINNFWNASRDSLGRVAASRWWEQHQITPDADGVHGGEAIQNEQDMAWIRTCPVPLYTTEPVPDNPRAVVWPVAAMAAIYRDNFACTFAMQIAQAIHERFEVLRVCGLELLRGTQREATLESTCVAYWLGLAEGRGIRLEIPLRDDGDEQWLLRHPYRYGHEYWLEADFAKEYCATLNGRAVAV